MEWRRPYEEGAGHRRWRALALILLLLSIDNLSAEEYPSKPITTVVGFGVGGSADRMARSMTSALADELGQPVQVINKRGAGTLLASNYVLGRPDDGYTLYASSFAPYLTNSILEGNAQFSIQDFSFVNLQWFDEDLIALSKRSKFKNFIDVLTALRDEPKTVRAACVRGSGGHLMARLLLESLGVPQENINLVTYNSGGLARAAVAGGIVDFIIISAKGSESIRDYLNPQAIISHQPNEEWGVPTLNQLLAPLGMETPVLPGSMRGFATSSTFAREYPERFKAIAQAFQRSLENPTIQQQLDEANIGRRWIGPEESTKLMRTNFELIRQYSYLLKE